MRGLAFLTHEGQVGAPDGSATYDVEGEYELPK